MVKCYEDIDYERAEEGSSCPSSSNIINRVVAVPPMNKKLAVKTTDKIAPISHLPDPCKTIPPASQNILCWELSLIHI